MARKSFLATLLGLAAFAAPNAFADQGGIAHDGSSGQGRPANQQQAPAATPAAPTHRKQGKAKGHAKTKVHAKAKAPATSVAPALASPHAKAGKTTICHATGSATNPYVTITISNNAIPAHQRHQDGRDIIPAPPGGCPATAAQQQPAQQSAATANAKSGSSAAAPAVSGAGEDKGGVLGASSQGSSGAPDQVRVLGATTSGRAPSASSSPAARSTRTASSGGLPFTGTEAIIVVILGLAALLLGVTVRRAGTNRI